MTSKLRDVGQTILFGSFAVPIVGLLLGAVYSWPAVTVTKGREPWLTLLLTVGLAVSVGGLGRVLQANSAYLAIVWAASVALLLLVRASLGGFDRNLERFGIVHVAALVFTVLAATVTSVVAQHRFGP